MGVNAGLTAEKGYFRDPNKKSKLLFETVKKKNISLKAYISAWAIGYSGAITVDKIFTESDLAATDFLGQVCQKWEASTKEFSSLGI